MPFRDVLGHRPLVALLSRSTARGRVPPSLILSGPAGVGKRMVAIATAQALNCTAPISSEASPALPAAPAGAPDTNQLSASAPLEPLEIDACGVCAACTKIARGIHPDVLVVEPGDTGSIKIEQARDVVDRAGYRPFEGRRRVVVVDSADALVPPAQNALLKTLEEPPASSVFMLITARPDMLLPTVRSRCSQLRFRALTASEIAAILVRSGRGQAEARVAAAAADGSVGRALEAADGDLMESRGVAMRVLSRAAVASDPGRRIECAKELLTGTGVNSATDRERVASYLEAMGSLLRDVEVVASGTGETELVNADMCDDLERLSAYRGARGVQAFTAVDRALDALGRSAGVKIVADWLVLHL